VKIGYSSRCCKFYSNSAIYLTPLTASCWEGLGQRERVRRPALYVN